MRAWFDAAAGKLEPFILVLEGSVPNEEISGDGYWATMGVDPVSGEPISTCTWIDRLAPRAAAVLALGTCAAFGGDPRDAEQPDRRHGTARLPRLELDLATRCPDHQPPRLPGAARQHHRDAAAPGAARRGMPVRRSTSTSTAGRAGCSAAPSSRAAAAPASPSRASSRGRPPITAGAWSSSAARARWRRATSRSAAGSAASAAARTSGGICNACTMPGFPDRFMPFMDADPLGVLAAKGARFTYGPVLRRLRRHAIRRNYDREPSWRAPGEELTSGYRPRW